MSPDEVRTAIDQSDLAKPLGALIDAGALKIQRTADFAAEAFTDEDGTIHLVAPKLSPGSLRSAVLHEAFHSRRSTPNRQQRMVRSNRPAPQYLQSGQAVRRRRSRGLRQGARPHGARAGNIRSVLGRLTPEEFGAYVISEHETMSRAFGDWAREVIGAVKAWALRRFGRQIGAVTPSVAQARHGCDQG